MRTQTGVRSPAKRFTVTDHPSRDADVARRGDEVWHVECPDDGTVVTTDGGAVPIDIANDVFEFALGDGTHGDAVRL